MAESTNRAHARHHRAVCYVSAAAISQTAITKPMAILIAAAATRPMSAPHATLRRRAAAASAAHLEHQRADERAGERAYDRADDRDRNAHERADHPADHRAPSRAARAAVLLREARGERPLEPFSNRHQNPDDHHRRPPDSAVRHQQLVAERGREHHERSRHAERNHDERQHEHRGKNENFHHDSMSWSTAAPNKNDAPAIPFAIEMLQIIGSRVDPPQRRERAAAERHRLPSRIRERNGIHEYPRNRRRHPQRFLTSRGSRREMRPRAAARVAAST